MTGTSRPAADTGHAGHLPEGSDPLPERLISDVETLKALSDPLRIQILEVMVQDWHASWTVKQIAKALGASPTKLYHHIRILEERELIRPVSQQLVRGILETSYRIAQLSLRLDRALLTGNSDAARAGAADAITSVFELARRDIDAALAAGLLPADPARDPDRPFALNRAVLRLTPERAIELRRRLNELTAEFSADAPHPDAIGVGFLVAMHPIAGPGGARRRTRS